MNHPSLSLWRLCWKEYRTQRALWLSVLILTLLIHFSVAVVAAFTTEEVIPAGHLTIGIVAVGVYLLGCGAMVFAIEHELGTYDFQRVLPVNAWRVVVVKLGTGLVGGLSLALALLFVEHAFFVGWDWVLSARDTLAGVISVSEVFFWAVLFSLLLRHPLRAAVAGIVAMTVVVCILLPLLSAYRWDEDILQYHRGFLETRLLILAGLFAVDTWLAWNWAEGKLLSRPQWLQRQTRASDYSWVPAGPVPEYRHARPIGWRRLTNVTWRQGRWVLITLCGLFLLATGRSLSVSPVEASFYSDLQAMAVLLSAFVFGLCTFTLDQWSYQFRFYADRGVRPRWLWLSRQVVWFTPVLVQIVVQFLFDRRPHPAHPSGVDAFIAQWGHILGALLIFTQSQLWAMLVRSTLVALVASIFTSMLAWIWTVLMVALAIPLWWSVLPIPLVALAVTYTHCHDWLDERDNRRVRLRLAALVGIPALAIGLGCVTYRVYEIPWVDPGISVAEYTRPRTAAEQQTIDLYRQAAALMKGGGSKYMASLPPEPRTAEQTEAIWLEAQRPALRPLEEAHARPPIALRPEELYAKDAQNDTAGAFSNDFLFLLRLQAESLTKQGELGEAWRYYDVALELLIRLSARADQLVARSLAAEEKTLLDSIVDWASHTQQTDDRLRTAVARLKSADEQLSNPQTQVKVNYVLWSRFLDGESIPAEQLGLHPDQARWQQRVWQFLPWEAARNQRLLNLATFHILNPPAAENAIRDPYFHRLDRWLNTSTLPHGAQVSGNYITVELAVWRRSTVVLILLADWQREHGELPESLAQLAERKIADPPVDPVTNEPFVYFPDGVEKEIALRSSQGLKNLPAKTPFLWSPGWSGLQVRSVGGRWQVVWRSRVVQLEENLEPGIVRPIEPVTRSDDE